MSRRLKWAQTTRLASFGSLVCFFLSFFAFSLLTNIFLHIQVLIYNIRKMKKEKNVEMMKTGPNDSRHVVWVIGMFFFLSSLFSLLTNILLHIQVLIYDICKRKEMRTLRRQKWAQMMPDALFGLLVSVFFLNLFSLLTSYIV